MTKSGVQSTLDYAKFKFTDSNRDINQKNLQRIKESLSKRNLLKYKPILVNENWEILDGQHRFEAAVQMNKEVYYEVIPDANSEDIFHLNINQKPWGAPDYFKYFCSKNYEEYMKLYIFMEERNVTLKTALLLLTSDRGAEPYYIFKRGQFKFPPPDEMVKINETLDQMQEIVGYIKDKTMGNKSYLNRATFIYSLIKFLSIPNLKFDIFRKKLEMKLSRIHACTLAKDYLQMFKDVYNYKNQEPLE